MQNSDQFLEVHRSSSQPMPALSSTLRLCTLVALLFLTCLCVAWELWLDPMVPGGSLFFLKAIPLLFTFYGVYKGNIYTMQWVSMLVLLYILEGVVRWYSDISSFSRYLGMAEFFFATIAFLCAIFYVHPAKKWAKARKNTK